MISAATFSLVLGLSVLIIGCVGCYDAALVMTHVFNRLAALLGTAPVPINVAASTSDFVIFAFVAVIGLFYVLLHRSREFHRTSVVTRTVFSTILYFAGIRRNLLHPAWLVIVVQDYVTAAITLLLLLTERSATDKPKRK